MDLKMINKILDSNGRDALIASIGLKTSTAGAGVGVRGALIQADEYANITTGGNRNETWSSRFGRGKLAGRKRYVILAAIVDFFAFVFAGQKNHCVDAINEQFLESGDAKTNF